MTQPETVTPAASNKPTFEEARQFARLQGAKQAEGDESWSAFLVKCHELSYLGVIDTQRDKHGKNTCDAYVLIGDFHQGQSKAKVFGTKTQSQRTQAAKLNAIIKLGQYTLGGTGEPLSTVGAFCSEHKRRNTDAVLRKSLVDFPTAFVKFAREQNKPGVTHMLDKDQWLKCMTKEPKEDKGEEDFWNAERKKLQKLTTAKPHQPLLDASTVKAINNLITKRLVDIAKTKQTQAAA